MLRLGRFCIVWRDYWTNRLGLELSWGERRLMHRGF